MDESSGKAQNPLNTSSGFENISFFQIRILLLFPMSGKDDKVKTRSGNYAKCQVGTANRTKDKQLK
ncbi:MAG TPA: hypothetical protein PKD83_03715 [Ignavibacteria bacterium]|nr:hypothetical protein [Ignavibacteria bacterium]